MEREWERMENGLTSRVRAQKWDREEHKPLLVRMIPVGLEVVILLRESHIDLLSITIERYNTCQIFFWLRRANVQKLDILKIITQRFWKPNN